MNLAHNQREVRISVNSVNLQVIAKTLVGKDIPAERHLGATRIVPANLFFFIFFYYYSYLMSMCNRMVMTDLLHFPPSFYQRQVKRPLSFYPFLHCYRSAFGLPALLNLSLIIRNYLSSSSSSAWSALCSHSASLSASPPRLLPLLLSNM